MPQHQEEGNERLLFKKDTLQMTFQEDMLENGASERSNAHLPNRCIPNAIAADTEVSNQLAKTKQNASHQQGP